MVPVIQEYDFLNHSRKMLEITGVKFKCGNFISAKIWDDSRPRRFLVFYRKMWVLNKSVVQWREHWAENQGLCGPKWVLHSIKCYSELSAHGSNWPHPNPCISVSMDRVILREPNSDPITSLFPPQWLLFFFFFFPKWLLISSPSSPVTAETLSSHCLWNTPTTLPPVSFFRKSMVVCF